MDATPRQSLRNRPSRRPRCIALQLADGSVTFSKARPGAAGDALASTRQPGATT